MKRREGGDKVSGYRGHEKKRKVFFSGKERLCRNFAKKGGGMKAASAEGQYNGRLMLSLQLQGQVT